MWSYQELEDANPNSEVTRGDGWLAVNGRVYVWKQSMTGNGYVIAEFMRPDEFGRLMLSLGRGTNLYHKGDQVIISTCAPAQPTRKHSVWEKLAKQVNPFGLYFRVM